MDETQKPLSCLRV